MGQLRASTRALLLTGAEPAQLLEQLDSVAEFIPDAFCATVFVAIADVDAQTLHYSRASHVPPVFATGSAPPELLTDGLVERRDRSIDEQIDRVAEVVAETVDLPVESVADEILRRLAPEAGYDDAEPRRLSDIRHPRPRPAAHAHRQRSGRRPGH